MKTVEEFVEEIAGSAALQDELGAVKDEDALAELLKRYNVDGTVEEFLRFVSSEAETDAEGEGAISDDDAEAVAGGIQAGDVTKQIRPEFVIHKPVYVSSLKKRYTNVI